jgi:hypothetical protein
MDAKKVYEQLSVPMPPEALHEDTSRGFSLTSIRAGFIIERLNQVFGLLGYGWRFDYGQWQTAGERGEIIVDTVFQWRMEEPGSYPVRFNKSREAGFSEWFLDRDSPAAWSEPIFSTGGGAILNRKGSQPFLDAHKSAVTSGLTKTAARLGVGIEIFKGENDNHVGEERKKPARQSGSRVSAPAPKAQAKPAPAANGQGSGFSTITAMIKAAGEELARLDKMAEQEVGDDEKSLVNLGHRMVKLGIKGPVIRLITTLLGEGPLTNKRVLALLNSAVFAREVEQAKQ